MNVNKNNIYRKLIQLESSKAPLLLTTDDIRRHKKKAETVVLRVDADAHRPSDVEFLTKFLDLHKTQELTLKCKVENANEALVKILKSLVRVKSLRVLTLEASGKSDLSAFDRDLVKAMTSGSYSKRLSFQGSTNGTAEHLLSNVLKQTLSFCSVQFGYCKFGHVELEEFFQLVKDYESYHITCNEAVASKKNGYFAAKCSAVLNRGMDSRDTPTEHDQTKPCRRFITIDKRIGADYMKQLVRLLPRTVENLEIDPGSKPLDYDVLIESIKTWATQTSEDGQPVPLRNLVLPFPHRGPHRDEQAHADVIISLLAFVGQMPSLEHFSLGDALKVQREKRGSGLELRLSFDLLSGLGRWALLVIRSVPTISGTIQKLDIEPFVQPPWIDSDERTRLSREIGSLLTSPNSRISDLSIWKHSTIDWVPGAKWLDLRHLLEGWEQYEYLQRLDLDVGRLREGVNITNFCPNSTLVEVNLGSSNPLRGQSNMASIQQLSRLLTVLLEDQPKLKILHVATEQFVDNEDFRAFCGKLEAHASLDTFSFEGMQGHISCACSSLLRSVSMNKSLRHVKIDGTNCGRRAELYERMISIIDPNTSPVALKTFEFCLPYSDNRPSIPNEQLQKVVDALKINLTITSLGSSGDHPPLGIEDIFELTKRNELFDKANEIADQRYDIHLSLWPLLLANSAQAATPRNWAPPSFLFCVQWAGIL